MMLHKVELSPWKTSYIVNNLVYYIYLSDVIKI